MNLTEIITEADLLVPNTVSTADKVVALNAFYQDFFNVVKIPETERFTSDANVSEYALSFGVREHNIIYVSCGVIKYHHLDEDTKNPLQNTYYFSEQNQKLYLFPAPYQSGLQGIVRIHRRGQMGFSSTQLDVVPDIPQEYHWTLTLALASYIANTQDDAIKASNYENQYKAAWNVAAQNYAKEVQA